MNRNFNLIFLFTLAISCADAKGESSKECIPVIAENQDLSGFGFDKTGRYFLSPISLRESNKQACGVNIYDTEAEKSTILYCSPKGELSSQGFGLTWSASGDWISLKSFDQRRNKAIFYSLKTKKTFYFETQPASQQNPLTPELKVIFSPQEETLLRLEPNRLSVYDTKSRKGLVYTKFKDNPKNEIYNLRFINDSEIVYKEFNQGDAKRPLYSAKKLNLISGKITPLLAGNSIEISDSSKNAVVSTMHTDGLNDKINYSIYDIQNKSAASVEIDAADTTIVYQSPGKNFFITNKGILYKKQKSTFVPKQTFLNDSILETFRDDESLILYKCGANDRCVFDLNTNKSKKIKISSFFKTFFDAKKGELQVIDNKNSIIIKTPNRDLQVIENSIDNPMFLDVKMEPTCVNPQVSVLKNEKTENCKHFLNISENMNEILKPFREAGIKKLCQSRFVKEEWDQFFHQNLSEEQADLYLMRFQKNGGFETEKHLSILNAILSSPIATKRRHAIYHVLSQLEMSQPLVQNYLAKKYPDFASSDQVNFEDELCLSEAEKAKFKSLRAKFFQKKIYDILFFSDGSVSLNKFLEEHQKEIMTLPESERKKMLEYVASVNTDSILERQLSGAFRSGIFYFVENGLAPYFGFPKIEKSDLILLPKGDSAQLVLLTSHIPFASKDSKPILSGPFYATVIKKIPSNQLVKLGKLMQVDQFEMNGKKFQATTNINVEKSNSFSLLSSEKPKYEEYWKNKQLTGLVVVGYSMKHNSGMFQRNFQDYFEENGFKITKKYELDSVKDWIKNKIISGEVDYFIKQAHSDGDAFNIFTLPRNSIVFEAEKSHPKGKELIYLIVPNEAENQENFFQLISNEEFGDWIRKREKQDGTQLLYVNGSCGSTSKAVNEILSAKSPLLLEIPTQHLMYTFTNNGPNREVKNLLNGIRGEKSYTEISKGDPNHVFIFPNEEEYREMVVKNIEFPVILEKPEIKEVP